MVPVMVVVFIVLMEILLIMVILGGTVKGAEVLLSSTIATPDSVVIVVLIPNVDASFAVTEATIKPAGKNTAMNNPQHKNNKGLSIQIQQTLCFFSICICFHFVSVSLYNKE